MRIRLVPSTAHEPCGADRGRGACTLPAGHFGWHLAYQEEGDTTLDYWSPLLRAEVTSEDAMTGLVTTGIIRLQRGTRRTWSQVEHICRVDHTYGPHKEWQWVVPICGAKPGRAATAHTSVLCGRCEKKADDGSPS